jgi:putative glycosyltransferase (TIGR04348 family)
MLTDLGHRVELSTSYGGGSHDVLMALHARRGADSVARFRETSPDRPVIVGLAGTDLYRDIKSSAEARNTLELATRLVVLQPRALDELSSHLHEKTRVIYQSARAPLRPEPKTQDGFQVCVLAHLREVKDPLRAAAAARRLPSASRVRVVHAGLALSEDAANEARLEEEQNPRYRWLEGLARSETQELLTASHLLVISSTMEGGANVVSEALAASVPILASRVPGNVGVLGQDYPGYFSVGDTAELAELLERTESDEGFYRQLTNASRRLAPLVDPAREKEAWRRLCEELSAG